MRSTPINAETVCSKMQPLLDQESQILVDGYAGGYTKRSETLVWKLAGLNVSNRKPKRGTHEAGLLMLFLWLKNVITILNWTKEIVQP